MTENPRAAAHTGCFTQRASFVTHVSSRSTSSLPVSAMPSMLILQLWPETQVRLISSGPACRERIKKDKEFGAAKEIADRLSSHTGRLDAIS